ncbi:WXG100 family type VII secretion target [Lentzea tibetensis]|uniref:ESAT-6-like protein n=1 Tax=Lentzea tibetensis TaxID=2591470 RepID=A0A563EJZ1_9PSEU|nr:WXG100 family type VII secretion target [Lentzea tibetensis]TWP46403.1 WXG100 family type VII secretion target [Lentzea tibetensis]
MSGEITVTFGELAAASGEITGSAGKIESELSDLKGRVDKVLAGYTGESAEMYQEAQNKWAQAAGDLQQVLNSIGVAVQQAADAYQGAEQQNARRWG